MIRLHRFFNALMIYTLCGILLSAYYQQFAKDEMPCPLCILQRLGMISAAFGALLNLKYGIKPYHYTISLFSAMIGASVSIRQILLHICPGSPTFGVPVLGLSLYTWAFVAFICVLFATGLLLTFYHDEVERPHMNWFESLACILLFGITLANLVTCYLECGFGPCAN